MSVPPFHSLLHVCSGSSLLCRGTCCWAPGWASAGSILRNNSYGSSAWFNLFNPFLNCLLEPQRTKHLFFLLPADEAWYLNCKHLPQRETDYHSSPILEWKSWLCAITLIPVQKLRLSILPSVFCLSFKLKNTEIQHFIKKPQINQTKQAQHKKPDCVNVIFKKSIFDTFPAAISFLWLLSILHSFIYILHVSQYGTCWRRYGLMS